MVRYVRNALKKVLLHVSAEDHGIGDDIMCRSVSGVLRPGKTTQLATLSAPEPSS